MKNAERERVVYDTMGKSEFEGKQPGDWCSSCPEKITIIRFGIVGVGTWGGRKEPCSSIMNRWTTYGETDSRCKASQQAKYNLDNNISGSL